MSTLDQMIEVARINLEHATDPTDSEVARLDLAFLESARRWMFPDALEAQMQLQYALGDQLWDHLLTPDRDEMFRLRKASLLILDTYIYSERTTPGVVFMPVTLIGETIEAVLGRKTR